MYARINKQEQEKADRKQQSRKENKTGIPISMKTRFEEMSGYSFDDVRVHYSSSRPARFNALAYTQGNQVHIAPGQEKYLEHELGHVVQQKEGRVKPTFLIGNVPVNNDKALEQEADIRLHSNQVFAPTERNTYHGQDVLQGHFIECKKGQIDTTPYYQQIGVILTNFLTTALDILSQDNTYDETKNLFDNYIDEFDNSDKFDKVYAKIVEIVDKAEEDKDEKDKKYKILKKNLARLDILINMIDHCKNNNDMYTHYQMYGRSPSPCTGSTQTQENPPNEPTRPLLSAIDCRKTTDEMNGHSFGNVLWIESFVSFEQNVGKQLLQEVISDSSNEDINYVALGAYPGTIAYYTGLGMKKLEDTYVREGGEDFLSSSDIVQEEIDNFSFYPVYYIKKNTLKKKLDKLLCKPKKTIFDHLPLINYIRRRV